jgi:hypothetical protein
MECKFTYQITLNNTKWFLHFIPINNFVDSETGLSGHVVLFQMFSY